MTMGKNLSLALVLLVVLQQAAGDVVSNYLPSSGEVYQLYDVPKKWSSAKSYCADRGAALVVVDSAEEQNFVWNFVKSSGKKDNDYWIGYYSDKNKNNVYRRVDGSSLNKDDVRFWGPTEPNEGRNKCVRMKYSTGGKWADQSCTNRNRIACERKITTSFNGATFMLSAKSMRHDEARKYCLGYGFDLASFTSEEEVDHIMDFARKHQGNGDLWTGLHKVPDDEHLQWEDGTPFQFKNDRYFSFWGSREPDKGTKEQCVKLWREDGRWSDVKCSDSYWAVCKRKNPHGEKLNIIWQNPPTLCPVWATPLDWTSPKPTVCLNFDCPNRELPPGLHWVNTAKGKGIFVEEGHNMVTLADLDGYDCIRNPSLCDQGLTISIVMHAGHGDGSVLTTEVHTLRGTKEQYFEIRLRNHLIGGEIGLTETGYVLLFDSYFMKAPKGWFRFTMVMDSGHSSLVCYVNGEKRTFEITKGLFTGQRKMGIGNLRLGGDNSFTDGTFRPAPEFAIDEVLIFETALTEDEVLSLEPVNP